MKKNLAPEISSAVIDGLGGTGAVARICDVEPASVSQWRKSGIPHARTQFLRLRNPDVFHRFDDQNARNKGGRSKKRH